MRRTSMLRITGALMAIGALGLAACGDDDDSDAASTTTTTAAEPETVEVTLVDYAFEGLPKSVKAGTRFTVVNDSKTELHEMVVIRIPDGEQRTVEELAQLDMDELAVAFGGVPDPDTVVMATPGGPMITPVGDGTLTKPGRYAVLCFIPTGVDPEVYLEAQSKSEGGPPQVDGAGPPHFVHGMLATLRVT